MQHLHTRPVYGPVKRLRRTLLKAAGRWPRKDYDVRLVFENNRPAYKQVIFDSTESAHRIGDNLARFGPSVHLPGLIEQSGNSICVEYVAGSSCRAVSDALLPALAQCFVEFARRGSRLQATETTAYPKALQAHLASLRTAGVIDARLHDDLTRRARATMPANLRVGFDYTDPIGANLIKRADTGEICAIDIKNLQADTLVGQGLAKASARWLAPARQPRFFAFLSEQGLDDIAHAFVFLQLFERAQRISHKVARDLEVFGRVRMHGREKDKLRQLAE